MTDFLLLLLVQKAARHPGGAQAKRPVTYAFAAIRSMTVKNLFCRYI